MTNRVKTFGFYLASVILVVAALLAFHPSQNAVGIYWAVTFWTIAGLDFYRSQVKENGASEVVALASRFGHGPFSFADRFIGYLFAAPFIAPARAYQLLTSR